MSWLERAIGWRRYFEGSKQPGGTKHVHRWIQVQGGTTTEWATRMFRELDEEMARERHDGASGWGMFRNDVTAWLAAWLHEHAGSQDRAYVTSVAACTARYLGQIGTGHAAATAPIAGRWHAALEAGDASAFAAVVDEARASAEMRTAGAGGVLPLIESSAYTLDMPLALSSTLTVEPAPRSGVPLAMPISVRVWPNDGGEQVHEVTAPIVIGYGEVDVRIANPHVSRKHCRIVVEGDVLVVEDLGSENGTRVFETLVKREALQQGDMLVLGGNLVFLG